jgi:hypothetical protein
MYESVNPEIPGLDGSNPGISGWRKSPGSRDPGIRDPGIAIPSHNCRQGRIQEFSTESQARAEGAHRGAGAPRGWGAGRVCPSPCENFGVFNLTIVRFGKFQSVRIELFFIKKYSLLVNWCKRKSWKSQKQLTVPDFISLVLVQTGYAAEEMEKFCCKCKCGSFKN